MKIARQWLRANKQFDNCFCIGDKPPTRREMRRYNRLVKLTDKLVDQKTIHTEFKFGKCLYVVCVDTRHGNEGWRVLKYNKAPNGIWEWDEWYQFYKTLTELCWCLGTKRERIGRNDF